MKYKLSILVVLILLLIMPFVVGCDTEEATTTDTTDTSDTSGEVFELSLATFWPSTDFQVSEGHERWIKEVEERTDGRVKITIHAGEALLGAREIYEGVASGVAHIGSTCPAYTAGMFPLTEAFELPGYLNANAVSASMTMQEGYKKMVEELGIDEYEDVKVLFFWATGPGDVMSRTPVRTMDDMSGMEIRAVGGTVSPIELLGGVAHSMPMSESYLALEQGLVEGILAPNDTLEGFKLAEVVSHVTKTPFLYNVVFMKIMNKDTWNSLPPDIQVIFEELNEEFALEYGKLRAEYTRNGLQYGIDEHDIEVIELSSDEDSKWRSAIAPVVTDWVEKMEGQGLPGEKMVELIKDLDKKYSEMYADY